MGQGQVFAPELLLVADEVCRSLLVSICRPLVGASGKAGKRHVHVVRRAAHEPDRIFRNTFKSAMPTLQILARLRDHVANVDRLARLGIWHQAGVSLPVLQVEDLGQRLGGAAQRGMV